ncbi:helix-turn-helix domain-containing protein [Aestuariibius sp. 2305UL40-4]|uniref:helix-turn-helix domain-containing protein n=1 Tax=Aestuariibius violaceus TaxID=3234132 RepID=UPI00345EB123
MEIRDDDLRNADAARARAEDVAARIRNLRVGAGLTLRDVGEATGLSISQISKLETGRARLTVDLALRLAGALRVPANVFFLEQEAQDLPVRPVLTRAGEALRHRLQGMDFEVLCSEVREKHALNWRVTVHGKTLDACGGLRCHAGEEFVHVLSGRLTLHFAAAPSVTLGPGDSLVFHGPSAHGYAAGDGPAVAIMTNSVAP